MSKEPIIMEDADERLRQEIVDEGSSLRGPRSTGGAARRPRELDDRDVVMDRELSDDERVEEFRQALFQSVLPDLPTIPGFHVCWLSTTHSGDTIPRRMRLGYTPIRPEEIPGMDYITLKTGEYVGMIGINEMVAFKIPLGLYQKYMTIEHHDKPAQQDADIVSQLDSLKEDAAREGGQLAEGDGMQSLRKSAPPRGVFS